jgi:hypothetical protein
VIPAPAEAGGAQDGVTQGEQEDVAVVLPAQTPSVHELDAAENQRARRLEASQDMTDADPHGASLPRLRRRSPRV